MTKPEFPVIIVDLELFVELMSNDTALSNTSAYALTSNLCPEGLIAYDQGGNKWTYEQASKTFKNTFFSRLLAKTVYNPSVPVTVTWTCLGRYDLKELKAGLVEAVEADDDI